MHLSLAEASPTALREGFQPVTGFTLVRRRGRGGFGEVWEARASGGFLVALKFVRLSSRAQTAELRALEFVRGIHHPNLLSNFGSWQVDDTLIIGMELADRSLWDRQIEANRQGLRGIPRGELLGYLGEVAAGIGHLNEYRHTVDGRTGIGVQHRDLKPTNILLFGGGAKVADLGLARAMEGEIAGHTGIWTFSFAAPEFFRGETARQSDQYSLAATYCQLRGGRLPFEGSAASVTAGHLFGQPDLEALPEAERPIVERALAKVPGDRWPDCRAFVDALRALPRDSVPDILIDPDGPPEIPREFRSSTGALFNIVTGSDPMEEVTPASGWRDMGTGSGLDSGLSFIAPRSNFGDTSLTPAEEAPHRTDSVPTRLFPQALSVVDHQPTGETPAAEIPPAVDQQPTDEIPAVEVPPASTLKMPTAPPRRSAPFAGYVRATVVVAAIAIIVAIGLTAPGDRAPFQDSTAADGVSTSTPPDLVLAKGMGSAAESEPEPIDSAMSTPLPAVPIEAAAAPRPPELGPEPAQLEPISPPAEAEVRLPSTPQTVTTAPPAASSLPPDVASPAQARPALVLEGPLEMDVTRPNARDALPEKRGSEPPERGRPAVAAPKVGESTPPAPESARRAEVATPPVPTRNLPGTLAMNDPSATLTSTRNLAPASNNDRVGPTPAQLAYARGEEFFLHGAFPRAVAEFEAAIRLDPGHFASYLHKAIARHRSGDPRAALADYAEVIRRRPDDVLAYISRGQAYYDLGAFDRAVADFDEAIRRRPADADAFLRRGRARYRLGDYAGSVDDFTATLRLEPQNARASEFRAESLARLRSKSSQGTSLMTGPGRLATTLTPLPTDSDRSSSPAIEAKVPANGGVVPSSAMDQGANRGQPAVRETILIVPRTPNDPAGAATPAGGQPRNAGPAARPGPNQGPPDRRKPPVRRLLSWPFARSR